MINKGLILSAGCRNEYCEEPTKERVGCGSYTGITAKERIMQEKSKHFNKYTCDKYKNGECKGDYKNMRNIYTVENPDGELLKAICNGMINNYRKLHHMPMIRGAVKKNLRGYKLK